MELDVWYDNIGTLSSCSHLAV